MASSSEIVVRCAGEGGQGVVTAAEMLARAATGVGYHALTFATFPSQILGGPTWTQARLSLTPVLSPGDSVDILVAFNPAALKANIRDLKPGATIIINNDTFKPANFKKASMKEDPRKDGSLSGFRVIEIAMSTLTSKSLEGLNLTPTHASRCKNYFAIGIILWL